MDVISLLNGNAAEQQKKGDGSSKTTLTRNRTPWDAGGYSLPINTLSTALASLSSMRTSTTPQNTQHIQEHGELLDMPSSPRHKFSDSRSSLSSFTSSLQSTSHSRYSSSSTVGSLQQFSSIGETLSPMSGPKKPSFDFGSLTAMEGARPSTSGTQSRGSISSTGSMEALVLAAEKHSVNQSPSSTRQPSNEDSQTTEKPSSQSQPERIQGERPSSPSDAILIKRSAVPSLSVNTGSHDQKEVEEIEPNRQYLRAPLENHTQALINIRGHKRALSAPDFAAFNNLVISGTANSSNNYFAMSGTVNSLTTVGPRPNPTPPASTHPDNTSASPTSPMASYPAPDTPPAANATTNSIGQGQNVTCMYIPNCDTGSQPRKAISHIFGRNKMCTRLIPQHVWVHYCRKHYQRSRYRNPKEYAKLQCDLVQQQIRRVHDWSEANKEKGLPGVVIDWSLAVRKREQKRLDDLNGASRKRNASALNDVDGVDEGRTASQPANTAVPDWLLAKCGPGYDTNGILEVFNRLHNATLNDEMSAFPDIEILPNISVTPDDEQSELSAKGHSKRPATTGHKRAQSLGVGIKSDYLPTDRRSSHSAVLSNDTSLSYTASSYGSPTQKRRRANDMSDKSPPMGSMQRSRFVERPLVDAGPSERRVQQFAHQNIYEIAENQASGDRFYTNSPAAYNQNPLPAPTPQRINGLMAANLETNQFANSRRPVHHRSQSDMGGFSQGRVGYSPTPSAVYAPEVNAGYARSPFHDGSVRQYGATPQNQWEPAGLQAMQHDYSQQVRPVGRQVSGHQRIQSSPMVGSFQGPSIQSSNSPSTSYGPSLTLNTRIVESQQARDVYSSRR